MAVYSNSELTGITIDRVWDRVLLENRYAKAALMPKVLNKSDKVRKSGEIVSIDIEGALSTGTVTGSTGAFTPAAPVPTQVNLTVDTWQYVAIEITDQAKVQSFWDPNGSFPKNAGKALAVAYDTALAALHSSITTNVIGDVDNPEAFGDGAARSGLLKLADLNVPLEDLNFFLPPVGFYSGLMAQVEFTAAHFTGSEKSTLISGQMKPLLGVPITVLTTLATVAGAAGNVRKGLLLHKESLAIAMQMEHDYKLVDRAPAGFLSHAGVTQSLYGVKAVRQNHAAVFNIRAS